MCLWRQPQRQGSGEMQTVAHMKHPSATNLPSSQSKSGRLRAHVSEALPSWPPFVLRFFHGHNSRFIIRRPKWQKVAVASRAVARDIELRAQFGAQRGQPAAVISNPKGPRSGVSSAAGARCSRLRSFLRSRASTRPWRGGRVSVVWGGIAHSLGVSGG